MSRWLTVREAAECTQRSRQWVHNRVKDGTFRAANKGRRVDIDGDSVQAWMVAEMQRLQDTWKFYYHHLPNGYHGEPKQ